jgi:hypothetical protein
VAWDLTDKWIEGSEVDRTKQESGNGRLVSDAMKGRARAILPAKPNEQPHTEARGQEKRTAEEGGTRAENEAKNREGEVTVWEITVQYSTITSISVSLKSGD